MNRDPEAHRPLLPLGAVLLTMTLGLLFILQSPPGDGRGLPMDDAYIHLDFARNLARHGELAFNHGIASGGTTSLGWDLLLMPPFWFGWNPLWWSLLLSLASHCLAVYWFARLMHRAAQGRNLARGTPLLAVLLFVFSGPLLWFATSGMETSLFLAAGLAAIFWFGAGKRNTAALWAGGAVFMRPDGLILAGALACITYVTSERTRGGRIRWALPFIVIPAAFYLPAAVGNLVAEGTPWPGTLLGRVLLLTLSFDPIDLGRIPEHFLWWAEFFDQWIRGRAFPRVLGEDVRFLSELSKVALPLLALLWGGVVLIARRGRRHPASMAYLLWCGMTWLAYGCTLPVVIYAGRYEAMILPLFCWATAWGAGWTIRALGQRMSRPAGLILAGGLMLVILLHTGLGFTAWMKVRQLAVAHIGDVHVRMGLFCRRLPHDRTIAAFDIGAIKYLNPDRRIADYAGLTDREMRTAIKRGEGSACLQERDVGYLAVMITPDGNPHPYPFDIAREVSERRLRLTRRFTSGQDTLTLPSYASDKDQYRRFIGAVRIAEIRMDLYRVDWLRD